MTSARVSKQRLVVAALAGAAVGCLGGLIGLGGAEFRLPLLIGLFGFVALEAVVVNKATSLIVVAFGLIFRSQAISWSELASHWHVISNLLAGSVIGAWVGADFATRIDRHTLHRVIAAMLVLIACVLLAGHTVGQTDPLLTGWPQVIVGLFAGVAIGIVAALLGVAGGELLIPTLVVLFGVGMKLAGSLSLAISLPTMLVAFTRYSRDGRFRVLGKNRGFVIAMALGSIAGALAGAALVPIVPTSVLVPLLAIILVISAIKVWRHSGVADIRQSHP